MEYHRGRCVVLNSFLYLSVEDLLNYLREQPMNLHYNHAHLDGQHDVCVALQHLHSTAVADIVKAHSIGSQDLVPHLYSILLSQTTRI